MEESNYKGKFISKEELIDKDLESKQTLKDFLAKYDRIARLYDNHYKISHKLASEIWKVRSKRNSKIYAMRIVKSNGSKGIFASFVMQIAIQRRISHPNFEEVVDYFEAAEVIYVVIEYTTGRNLKSLINSMSKLSEVEIAKYFVQVCDILKFTAEHNLALRDLRPENFIIKENQVIKLANLTYCAETSGRNGKMYYSGYS